MKFSHRTIIGEQLDDTLKSTLSNQYITYLGVSLLILYIGVYHRLDPETKETIQTKLTNPVIILNNISTATSLNRSQLIQKIKMFEHQTILPLSLKNFVEFHNIPLQMIYKRGGWKRLCQLAEKIEDFDNTNEKQIISAISKKWLSTSSSSYFQFILKLARQEFNVSYNDFNDAEKSMMLTLMMTWVS